MKNLCLFLVLLFVGCSNEKGLEKEQTIKKPKAIQTKEVGTEEKSDAKCKACIESKYAETEPDTVFDFSSGQRLLICGGAEVQNRKKLYSEFVISDCGNKTLIGFWGAVEKYEVDFSQDTLKLSKKELLAVGKNREFIETTSLTESFFYLDNKLQRVKKLHPKIKYSTNEIERTLQEYEATAWKTQIEASEEYTEDKLRLANRLMIAAVSGSKKAEGYFKDFPKKFRPDGAYSEWYREMEILLDIAKKTEK